MLDPLFWCGWESRFMLGVLITGKPLPVDSFGCVKWIMVARLEHLSKSLQPLPLTQHQPLATTHHGVTGMTR